MNKNIWFVVLTYRPNVPKLLARLKKFRGAPFVLVDNSETTNEYPSWMIVIRTGKNLGYTGGMNRGIRHALSQGGRWVVVTNDDLNISQAGISSIAKQLEALPPGVAGPFPGKLDERRWTTIYPARTEAAFDYLSGSCLAIHKDVVGKIGLFYEPYFIYYEDVELCVRAKKAGFLLHWLPAPGIYHKDGATFGVGSPIHEYYLARNHLLFVLRNAPWQVKIYELLRLPKTMIEYFKKL